jgi:NAD(P)-dependent dehydrogenase (short-subunit alcohol dehydrogenase family)
MSIAQQPIGSGFDATSRAADIAAGHDLTGKIAVVTGGNSGIGYETVKALAQAGAQVIVGARDAGKAADRLDQLERVVFFPLDLADPVSVDVFAERVLANYRQLHFLINNAGLFRVPELRKDKRGYELQFGVNHLGHFQLTGRLWPVLKNAGGARVVALSSVGHRRMGVQLDDVNFDRQPFDTMKAYGQSKTANVLFAVELDRVGQEYGVRAFAVHPGAIRTEIFRYMSAQELKDWEKLVNHFKTLEQGAATAVWCALSDRLNGLGGVYCEDCDIAALLPDDSPAGYGVRSFAVDPDRAAALWRFSEAVTGIRWP